MARNVWDEPIDKNIPWDGNKNTNNLPVRGRRVEEFLKDSLNSKIGVLYYDATNNRYLAFTDEEERDKYIVDPTLTYLVLGTFDAPFNYSAEINLVTPSYNAVFVGSTGHYIDFTFDVKNKNGLSTGDDVLCTYTFIKGSTKQVVKEKYRAGTAVHFNIDDFITEGVNRITIGIVGQTTLAASTIGITYQVVKLNLYDELDISKVYNLLSNPNCVAEVEYTVEGEGTKTMEWYVDGVQLEFVQVEDQIIEPKTSRTKYIDLSNFTNGKHSLQYRCSTVVEGEKFYSNTLYRDFIVYTGENNNPIIAISATIPSGFEPTTDETLNLRGIIQFEPYPISLTVYNPSSAASTEARVFIDDELKSTLTTHNGEIIEYTIISTSYGVKELRIEALGVVYDIPLNINKTTISLSEITEALQLEFQASGKSNNDADKDIWSFGEYSGIFSGFNWNDTSGWVNKRLRISEGAEFSINVAPLSPDPLASGKTLEFEFSTINVSDDDAIICDLRNEAGVGILITASKVSLTSIEGKTLITEYKSGENLRIAFVLNKRSGSVNKGLAFIYVNGIVSGSVNFSTTDLFTSDTNLKIKGSSDATVLLKDLRFYNQALSSDQILNNYILYRDSATEMLRVYDRNNVYEQGTVKFSLDALNAQLPVMIFTGNIPELEATSDKDYTINVDIEYTNLQDPTLNFTMKNGKLRLQGTSSLGYPRKNYRFYSNKSTATEFFDADGQPLPDRKYSFKHGAQPVDCWCLKADFAESSGTHNTGIARLWGDILYNVTLDGEYVCRTNAQKAALAAEYPYDVRTTIDGFPIIVAYRLREGEEPIIIGKYNFNNDKSTESVFGFCNIPGFDDSNVQCWEVLNNGDALALFQSTQDWDSVIDSETGKKRWEQAYEARYPDKNKDTTFLKAFCDWVVSTKDNIEKFKTEKWDHCNVYMMAAYYVYAIRHGAVDQIVKNSMLTTEDGQHFFWILYDNDTVNGLRNDGRLRYPPTIDRQSLDEEFTEITYAYAGHDSVLWNNMEADDEFMRIVIRIDNALYTAGLTYNAVINMFDTEQANKWCERIYNLDAQYKYISPFTDQGLNYLELLQGSRQSHRRWWLSRRFNLIDSKFVSGEYKAKGIELKLVGCPPDTKFKVTSGYDMNYGYGINTDPIQYGIHLSLGESFEFSTPNRTLNIGDPLYIYASTNIAELDFSNFTPYLSQINIGRVYSESLGTMLKKLILGVDVSSDTRRNIAVRDISGIQSAERLEYLDIGGYEGISNLDLSKNTFLHTLKAYGSGLTGVTFAEGGAISSVQLPETMQALVLKNLPYLSTSGLNIAENGKNLRVIAIQNCAKLRSTANFIFDWYASKASNDAETSLTLTNITWNNVDPEKLISLGNIKFAGGTLSLKGKIYLTSCDEEQANRLVEIFGTKAFDKENELYINAPDAIYLTGPDSINAGETAQFYATVFSENKGTVTYSISGSYVSINQNGLVTSRRFAGGTYTCTVTAKHTPTEGKIVTVTKTFTLKGLVTISSLSISGDATIGAETKEYRLTLTPSEDNITTSYTISWGLSGDAYTQGLIEIVSQSSKSCVLKGKAGVETLTCTLTVSSKDEFNSTRSATKTITVYEEGLILTSLEAPKVLTALYEGGLIGSNVKMYDYEVASITCLKNVLSNVDVERLDWISKTSITNIGAWSTSAGNENNSNLSFNTHKLLLEEELILPDTVTSVNLSYLPRYASNGQASKRTLTRIFIPSTVTTISGHTNYLKLLSVDEEFKLEISKENPVYEIDHGIIKDKNTGLFVTLLNLGWYNDNNGYWADKDVYLPEGTTDTFPPGGSTGWRSSMFYCKRFILPSTITYIPSGGITVMADELVINPNIPVSSCDVTSYYGGWLYDALIRKVTIPGTWETLPRYFLNFNSNSNFLEEVVISEGVKVISYNLIGATNNKITVPSNFKITIPSTVTTIGRDILYITTSSSEGFVNLQTIQLPRSLESLHSEAFGSVQKYIKEYIIDESNQYFSTVDGLLYNKDHTELLKFPALKPIENNQIDIPENVKVLASTCFSGRDLSSLTINFPSNLLEIGNNVLDGYKYPNKLPDTVTKIGEYAYRDISEPVELPRDLEELGRYAFYSYGVAEPPKFNNKLKIIGDNFLYESLIRHIRIPESVEAIGNYLVYKNPWLKYIELPSKVSSLGYNAVSDCSNLDTVVFRKVTSGILYNSTRFGDGAGVNTMLSGNNKVYAPSDFKDLSKFTNLVRSSQSFSIGTPFARLAIVLKGEWVLNKVVTMLNIQGVQQEDGYYYFAGITVDSTLGDPASIFVDGVEIGKIELMVGKDNLFTDMEEEEEGSYDFLDQTVCEEYINNYLQEIPEGFQNPSFSKNNGLYITNVSSLAVNTVASMEFKIPIASTNKKYYVDLKIYRDTNYSAGSNTKIWVGSDSESIEVTYSFNKTIPLLEAPINIKMSRSSTSYRPYFYVQNLVIRSVTMPPLPEDFTPITPTTEI